jgi:hypothetical protein
MASRETFGYEGDSNSTTTPLGGGATFTGQWEINGHYDVMVSCQASAAGTLYLDFSVDNGDNFNTFPENGFVVAAGIHEFHIAVKGPRAFRARFVNGATDQTYLRLFVYYGRFQKATTPLNQAIGLDADATLVRTTPSWLDIARGLTSGMTTVQKFGRNTAVASTYVPVCLGSIYRTPQAAAATALRIKAGGDAGDTSAGAGAREITLEGLDENFAAVTETLATAGASASTPTTTTFTRLFRAYVSASGTYASTAAGSHVDDIVIENGAGGTDWATIDSTNFPKSQSEIGAYSVAAGKTAYVFLTNVSVDGVKVIDMVFFHRAGIDDTAVPYSAMRAKSVNIGVGGGITSLVGSQIPFGPFTGPCDVGFLVKGTGTPSVSVEFDIYLLAE